MSVRASECCCSRGSQHLVIAHGLEETGSLFVGKEVQQPKQFPVDASGRGDYREQEGETQTLSLPGARGATVGGGMSVL